ncbi:AAA domain protein [uncultured archaeon]|nr:AAA domain protein [uncultured archaeon]
MNNIYIITGGPASGKTTLIRALRKKGFKCFDEVAREIIKEQLASKGDIVPWIKLAEFNMLVLQRQINQHLGVGEELHFFDRGIPDNIAYLTNGNLPVHPALHEASKKHRYNEKIFFLEPWREIYKNDEVRKEPFDAAVRISEHIKNAYLDLKYEVIVVPKVSVKERVSFILSHVSSNEKKNK